MPKPRKTQRYGWRPQLPDQRDFIFAGEPAVLAALPPLVDMRAKCPPVYDQGQLGSCTANAIAGAIQFDRMNQKFANAWRVPSRLFIYYNERVIEGTVSQDAGADLRDGLKTVATQGACFENLWPYHPGAFAKKPPPDCYTAALPDEARVYSAIPQLLEQMKACLAAGHPFVFGFTVYESFESDTVAASGIVPMPGQSEQVVGGHAVLAVGYDDAKQRFIVRNSWGADWGQSGYFTIPYAYLTDANLSSDFWTIKTV